MVLKASNDNNAPGAIPLSSHAHTTTTGYATSIHGIMNPGSEPGVHHSLKTNIIDPRLIENTNIGNQENKVEFLEVSKEAVMQIGIKLLNTKENSTLEEFRGLFTDILKYGLVDIHASISVNTNTSYSPIESACYLDNALSSLETDGKVQSFEHKLLEIWRQVFQESLGCPEGKSFEFMARIAERLKNKKEAA